MVSPPHSRRTLLLGLTAGLAASALPAPFIRPAQASVTAIRIGLGLPPQAQSPIDQRAVRFGVEAALRQANGRALGLPVQVVPFEETDAATTAKALRDLVRDQGIVGLIGGATDATALSLRQHAAEARVPLIIHSAMADAVTGPSCDRWTYRIPAPIGAQLRALRPYLAEYARRWFVLTAPDGADDHALTLVRAGMDASGATEAGRAELDPRQEALDGVVAAIRSSGADAVLSCVTGPATTRFLKAWAAAGLKDRMPLAQVGATDTELWAAGPQLVTGIHTKTYHARNPRNPPEARELTAAYGRQFNGDLPPATMFQAHVAMAALLSSLSHAGTTDPARVVAALDHFGSPFGDMTLRFTRDDHQMMHRIAILETKTKIRTRQDFWDVEAFAPEKPDELEAFYAAAAGGSAACAARKV